MSAVERDDGISNAVFNITDLLTLLRCTSCFDAETAASGGDVEETLMDLFSAGFMCVLNFGRSRCSPCIPSSWVHKFK